MHFRANIVDMYSNPIGYCHEFDAENHLELVDRILSLPDLENLYSISVSLKSCGKDIYRVLAYRHVIAYAAHLDPARVKAQDLDYLDEKATIIWDLATAVFEWHSKNNGSPGGSERIKPHGDTNQVSNK